MKEKENTKEKILALGRDLIRDKGYNAFSYQHISSLLHIKNAAIHYHYPSKEVLGVDVIHDQTEQFLSMAKDLHTKGANEWAQLEAFFDIYRGNVQDNCKVCIVGSLGPDYYTIPEKMQEELRLFIQTVLNWLTSLLAQGREKRVFHFKAEPRTKALSIITNLAAGLYFARVSSKDDFYALVQNIKDELQP